MFSLRTILLRALFSRDLTSNKKIVSPRFPGIGGENKDKVMEQQSAEDISENSGEKEDGDDDEDEGSDDDDDDDEDE